MSGFFNAGRRVVRFAQGEWDEEKHPRDGGKFAPKEGRGADPGGGGKEATADAGSLPEFVTDRLDPARPSQPFKEPVYHGSSNADLDVISADPPVRQYDNGTSQLGAFIATDRQESERYGDNLYTADLELNQPFEMQYSLFAYLQDPTKSSDRKPVDGEQWGARLEELRNEGRAIRNHLSKQGYDGIIVRDSKGNIKEIASFTDIQMRKVAKEPA